jgi:ceramide glucosyltransferase
MLYMFATTLDFAGNLAIVLALAYSAVALLACLLIRRASRTSAAPGAVSAVSVLKPLCGSEAGLYDNLKTFCEQAHPCYQLVFGTNAADDPALGVAYRLQREYPDLDIQVTTDAPQIGRNRKVENLAHMLTRARHDVVLIADSDIRVDPDYLSEVTAPLDDLSVGLVTCLYRARPRPGLWSRLGAQYIDDWFRPSVLIAHLFGDRDFAFGATIALRRETLDAIGGFPAVANHLADDYQLGALTQQLGLRTVLSSYTVDTVACEPTFQDLRMHERRWMMTIRAAQPLGYMMSVVTVSLPLALFGLILTGGARDSLMLTITVLGLRLAVNLAQSKHHQGRTLLRLALVPVREFLTAYAWCGGLFCSRVQWRDQEYAIARDGSLQPIGTIADDS